MPIFPEEWRCFGAVAADADLGVEGEGLADAADAQEGEVIGRAHEVIDRGEREDAVGQEHSRRVHRDPAAARPVASRVRTTWPAPTARWEKRTSLSGGAARIIVARTSSFGRARDLFEARRLYDAARGRAGTWSSPPGSRSSRRCAVSDAVRAREPAGELAPSPAVANAAQHREHRFARAVGDVERAHVVGERSRRGSPSSRRRRRPRRTGADGKAGATAGRSGRRHRGRLIQCTAGPRES